MMGDLSGTFVNAVFSPLFIYRATPMARRDARMVSGFDLVGHNRTFQVHWFRRVLAFLYDLAAVFTPLWILLYVSGIRNPEVYGILGGVVLFAYSALAEAAFRRTLGKFLLGLEVRSVRGRVTPVKAIVRNIPKLFWFMFPFLDTVAGLLVDGDPRQRWSDKVLGTTVVQSELIHVRVHRADVPGAGAR